MTLLTLPTTGDLAGKTKKELNEMLETKYSPSDLKTTSKNDVITFVRAELAMKLEQGTDLKAPIVSCEDSVEGHQVFGKEDKTPPKYIPNHMKDFFKEEKPEKKKREKLDYASVFTNIVSNIKSEVFNIDPVNVKSCYLSVKSGLKGTNYVICINNKVHRIELYTTLSENKPIFSYINRDVRKVNKDILFEAPADRKAMKMILEIPATDNIEEDAIDIASKADEFLKVIEPIVHQQIANIEISKNK